MMGTVTLILLVLAFVLFMIAAFWPVPPEPLRSRLVAGGLAAWVLAELLGHIGH